MKTYNTILFTALIIFSFSCSKNKDEEVSEPKGLITFKTKPYFESQNIKFAISIQYSGGGKAANCEYEIYDGAAKISQGSASCSNNTEGMGIFWESSLVSVPTSASIYSGKTLTVKIDPANKITLSTYTTPTYVDLYKVEGLLIP
jgi:hypothetical protein